LREKEATWMVIANKSRVEESILLRGRYVIDTCVAVVNLAPTLVLCVRVMVFGCNDAENWDEQN
jgi:hypothetical protein